MKWIDLKIHLAPLFMKQINEVSKNYMSKYIQIFNPFLLIIRLNKRITFKSRTKQNRRI